MIRYLFDILLLSRNFNYLAAEFYFTSDKANKLIKIDEFVHHLHQSNLELKL